MCYYASPPRPIGPGFMRADFTYKISVDGGNDVELSCTGWFLANDEYDDDPSLEYVTWEPTMILHEQTVEEDLADAAHSEWHNLVARTKAFRARRR